MLCALAVQPRRSTSLLVVVGIFTASAALAQPGDRVGRREFAAHVTVHYLDSSDSGVGYFENTRVVADERLVRRGNRVELVVRGRSETHGAFLAPSGPHDPRVRNSEFEHRWTGDARNEGDTLVVHLDHTTATRPARACDLTLRCVPDEELANAIRCTSTRPLGHHGNDRLYPSYLRVPLRLGRGRWLTVDAHGSSSGSSTARAR